MPTSPTHFLRCRTSSLSTVSSASTTTRVKLEQEDPTYVAEESDAEYAESADDPEPVAAVDDEDDWGEEEISAAYDSDASDEDPQPLSVVDRERERERAEAGAGGPPVWVKPGEWEGANYNAPSYLARAADDATHRRLELEWLERRRDASDRRAGHFQPNGPLPVGLAWPDTPRPKRDWEDQAMWDGQVMPKGMTKKQIIARLKQLAADEARRATSKRSVPSRPTPGAHGRIRQLDDTEIPVLMRESLGPDARVFRVLGFVKGGAGRSQIQSLMSADKRAVAHQVWLDRPIEERVSRALIFLLSRPLSRSDPFPSVPFFRWPPFTGCCPTSSPTYRRGTCCSTRTTQSYCSVSRREKQVGLY